MDENTKQNNEYIVQFSGDEAEQPPLISVTINQYWSKDRGSEGLDEQKQKEAE